VELVFFLLGAGREVLLPFLHDHVARGASAFPAARVLEMHTVPEQHVEHGTRLAIVRERPRTFELDGALRRPRLVDDADLRQDLRSYHPRGATANLLTRGISPFPWVHSISARAVGRFAPDPPMALGARSQFGHLARRSTARCARGDRVVVTLLTPPPHDR